MRIGSRLRGETSFNFAVIFLVMVLGAISAVILVQQNIVSSTTLAQYGIWVLLGLIALFTYASGTKSKWDDILVSYLLFLSIGGVGATWLINNNHVEEGYLTLGLLFLLFIIILGIYSRTGYKAVRGARF